MEISNDEGAPHSSNFQICKSSELGRYLIATKDIKKGEIILQEGPLVCGPIKGTDLSCPGCFQQPTTSCKLCKWPICSLECPGIKTHEQFECKLHSGVLERIDKKGDSDYYNRVSGCLMIIRCLLLKRIDPRKWHSFMEMASNWEQWSTSAHYSSAVYLESVIRNEYLLSQEEYSSNDILKVQAILDINAYEVQLGDTNIQAAYKTASLAEHNCTPNAHKSICADTLELTFRAANDIPKGSHISTTYCDVLWPTWHRQQFLQWSKFFTCACERCQSPTELDSQLASFVCYSCVKKNKSGLALPLFQAANNWANTVKDYSCTQCKTHFPAIECQMIVKKAEDELSQLDKYASPDTIPIFEQWLIKWTLIEDIVNYSDETKTCGELCDDNPSQLGIPQRRETDSCYVGTSLLLHPQNSLVLDACHTLFLLYPKEDSTLELLKRKECFGTHLLHATKPLFTGISKFRGTISYELAMTKAALLVNQLEENGLTDSLHHLAEVVSRYSRL